MADASPDLDIKYGGRDTYREDTQADIRGVYAYEKASLKHLLANPSPEVGTVDGFVGKLSGYDINIDLDFYKAFNNLLNQAHYSADKQHLYPYCLGILLSRANPVYEKALCHFCHKAVKVEERFTPNVNNNDFRFFPPIIHKKCYDYVLKEQKAKHFVDESAKQIPEGSEITDDIIEKLRKVVK